MYLTVVDVMPGNIRRIPTSAHILVCTFNSSLGSLVSTSPL